MLEVLLTEEFEGWLQGLDKLPRVRVSARLRKLAAGLWGDAKMVGGSVVELREHFGAGYRIYVWQRGAKVVIVLAGGDKSSQATDIEKAIEKVSLLKGRKD